MSTTTKDNMPVVATITVPVRRDWYPGQKSGSFRFKVADCMVDVSDVKTGKEIAHMGGAFGGIYEINFPDGKGQMWAYSISPQAFYDAFKKMHEELLANEAAVR